MFNVQCSLYALVDQHVQFPQAIDGSLCSCAHNILPSLFDRRVTAVAASGNVPSYSLWNMQEKMMIRGMAASKCMPHFNSVCCLPSEPAMQFHEWLYLHGPEIHFIFMVIVIEEGDMMTTIWRKAKVHSTSTNQAMLEARYELHTLRSTLYLHPENFHRLWNQILNQKKKRHKVRLRHSALHATERVLLQALHGNDYRPSFRISIITESRNDARLFMVCVCVCEVYLRANTQIQSQREPQWARRKKKYSLRCIPHLILMLRTEPYRHNVRRRTLYEQTSSSPLKHCFDKHLEIISIIVSQGLRRLWDIANNW